MLKELPRNMCLGLSSSVLSRQEHSLPSSLRVGGTPGDPNPGLQEMAISFTTQEGRSLAVKPHSRVQPASVC